MMPQLSDLPQVLNHYCLWENQKNRERKVDREKVPYTPVNIENEDHKNLNLQNR